MIDDRLAELDISLPEPAAPVASYVPAVEVGGFLYICIGTIFFSNEKPADYWYERGYDYYGGL